MKEIIYSFVAVILLSLVVEIFCPTRHMKKITMSAFSLVCVFIIISGTIKLLNQETEVKFDLYDEVSYSLESISASSVKLTRQEIINILKTEGIRGEIDVEIEYVLNEYSIEYTKVVVTLSDEKEKDKVREIVRSILPSVSEEDIVIV